MNKTQAVDDSAPAPSFLEAIASIVDYGFLRTLRCNPDWEKYEPNRQPRQVRSGHYVPVAPQPLPKPSYVAHSRRLLAEVFGGRVDDSVARSAEFVRFFSGDLSGAIEASGCSEEVKRLFNPRGWATGYALSIMGQEYYQQDPFKTGNGYGDGRAISVLEVACPQPQQPPQSWEFQLKGSGQTPYCRGADGRAVLRSSIREFLGAEAMHRLGVATARALCLIVSGKEMVRRPWYSKGSTSEEPDVMMAEPAAITTRVAPSLLRVGQLELFGRRARKKEHPDAMMELAQIVAHAAQREYAAELGPVPPWQRRETSQDNTAETPNSTTAIDPEFQRHVLRVAAAFRGRLIALVGHWIRVGFCQGNFNSDNCSVAGRTLDYGPFGFMELFNHSYQSWTGGGDHYSFLGQLGAAGANFKMFCVALTPLFEATDAAPLLKELNGLVSGFNAAANDELMRTFASKLGLARLDATQLTALMTLLSEHPLDYTIFFRTLGSRPTTAAAFRHAIYPIGHCATCAGGTGKAETAIAAWLQTWHKALEEQGQITAEGDNREWAARMDVTNPKYVPREWMLAAAYRAAIDSQDYSLVHELQAVFDDPYAQHVGEDNTDEKLWESKYFRRASVEDLSRGGVAVMSCSS
jgi:uncharacterized protein YdiU (UPF0061 family)